MRKLLLLSLATLSMNASAEVISLTAISTPPNCRAGQQCDIYGYHEIHIINASYEPETFHYGYQLCIEGICDNAQNVITVYPGQRWDNTRQSHLTVRMAEGKHNYTALTECGKERVVNGYTIKAKR